MARTAIAYSVYESKNGERFGVWARLFKKKQRKQGAIKPSLSRVAQLNISSSSCFYDFVAPLFFSFLTARKNNTKERREREDKAVNYSRRLEQQHDAVVVAALALAQHDIYKRMSADHNSKRPPQVSRTGRGARALSSPYFVRLLHAHLL